MNDVAEEPIPAGSEPEEAPSLTAMLADLGTSWAEGFADLRQELRDQLALDRFKEDQIARLHEELQSYKSDLLGRPVRLLLQGLIRLHDDLAKMIAALKLKSAEDLTPERFFQQLADFQDDIELLLGQHGVERFAASGEVFDPRRQTAARTVATDDPGLVGRIAERLRPGFEQTETLLQKERVAVYVAPSSGDERNQGGKS